MTDTEKAKKTRQIFIVSDGTAITAETLAHSILTQFPDLHYHQTRIPFVNSCLLYTSPSPRDATLSRMPSSA